MINNSDLEKAWFLYKTEYEPQNISINDFCMRKRIPHREFNKWFRNTHKQVVPVEVEGIPDNSEPAPPQSDAAKVSNTMSPRKSGIHVFIRKQSFRAVLCTLIYISTFVPNLNFGQDEHKRRRQVLCLNGSQVPNRVLEQEPSRVL